MIRTIMDCLRSVRQARFFDTERGYQGEFLAELRARLPRAALPGGAIVEQEYQKRLPAHGIRVRPDIIIHVPTLPGGNHQQGNFVVFELKLRAGRAKAREAFINLDAVLGPLDYPLGVFVNIASSHTQAAHYDGAFGERFHFFAVQPTERRIQVTYAYYRDGTIIEKTLS